MLLEKQTLYLALASACAFTGAAFDMKSRRIPNFITLPALACGLAVHALTEGWAGLLTSTTAALICGAVFLVFYLAGGMGAGDVKLMAAIGGIAGVTHSMSLLVLTALAGGVMAVVLALVRGRLKQTLFNMMAIVTHHRSEGLTPHPEFNVSNAAGLRLPYGVAIAAGCCATLWLERVGV